MKATQKHKTFAQDYYRALHALGELEALVPEVVALRADDFAVARLIRPNALPICVLVQRTPKASAVVAS